MSASIMSCIWLSWIPVFSSWHLSVWCQYECRHWVIIHVSTLAACTFRLLLTMFPCNTTLKSLGISTSVSHALVGSPIITHHSTCLILVVISNAYLIFLPDQVNIHAGLSPTWVINAGYTHCSAHGLNSFPLRSGAVPLRAVLQPGATEGISGAPECKCSGCTFASNLLSCLLQVSCAVLASIPGGSSTPLASSTSNIPPSINLIFPNWFSARASSFGLDSFKRVAAGGALSPLFQTQHRRSLLQPQLSEIGAPRSVILDSSSSTPLIISNPGSFNGSSSLSGGTIYMAFGSQLPFSLLPCEKGQIPGTGSSSDCGVSAKDSAGKDLSSLIISLNNIPSSASSLRQDAMSFSCDPTAAMAGNCLPGSYNLTYTATDQSGLTATGFVLLVVEYRTQYVIWIADQQPCSNGSAILQTQVRHIQPMIPLLILSPVEAFESS